MNSKAHFIVSLVKSGIRIIGCCLAICHNSLLIFASAFLLAEILGIFEEIFDKR